MSRRIKNRRRAFRLFTWNKTSQVNEKKNIVKERNKSKQWYLEWYVKPATPGKSKECVTKQKRCNFFIQAQFSPSTRQGPPEPTGLFIKINFQTTLLYKNNPGYKDRSRCLSMSNKGDQHSSRRLFRFHGHVLSRKRLT